MQRLQKQLLSALLAASPLPASHFHRRLLSAATRSPARFVAEDYLVASCGLTAAQAIKASKRLRYLKSPSNPDAVRAFLADLGLCKADIAAAISRDPRFLQWKVDETLSPQVARLRSIGLSTPQIGRLITVVPSTLSNPLSISRLEFYLSFLGSFDKVHAALRNNYSLLHRNNIEDVVKPNIAFLRQCGLTTCDIAKLLLLGSRILILEPEHVKEIVGCVDKLGVPRESAMFKHALMAVAAISPVRISAKLSFLKKALGCSDTELGIAVFKLPQLLVISEGKLSRTLEFLKMVVGLEHEYIVQRPVLFGLSLEKRLMPRHYIVKVLKSKGLVDKDVSFYTTVCLSEAKFVDKFIDRYKKSVPGLADAYSAACAGQVPPEI